MNHGASGQEWGQKEYAETEGEKNYQNMIYRLELQVELIFVGSEDTNTGILLEKSSSSLDS